MNDALNQRLRAELHELADGGRPVNLAHAALRGAVRRRRTRSALVISAAAAIVAVTTFTVAGPLGRDNAPPAGGTRGFVVSSFRAGGDKPSTYLLDPRTGRYRKTPYSWTVVSPDGRQAVVLAATGPDGSPVRSGIGILDLRRDAVRWLPTPQPVQVPVWSPDGETVLATVPAGDPASFRSGGFVRVDVASGRVASAPVSAQPPATGPFLWGPDGTTVVSSTIVSTPDAVDGGPGGPTVYDLTGRPLRHLAVPGNVLTLDPWSLSGRLLVLDGEAAGGRPQQLVVDASTGRVVARVDTPHPALGWRDDTHLLVRTDEGAVQSVEIPSGTRRNLATLPQRDIDDVFLTPAAGLSDQARKNAF
ncbi:MAG: hypothetical protein ACR2J0_00510 [Mycobacteriales bacterium]